MCDSANTCTIWGMELPDKSPPCRCGANPTGRPGFARDLARDQALGHPKGWPWPDCEDCEAAAEEAREEAGVLGRVQTQPCGSFIYEKRRSSGPELVRADVYVIEVTSLLD